LTEPQLRKARPVTVRDTARSVMGSLLYNKLVAQKPPQIGKRLCEKVKYWREQAQWESNWPQGAF